MLAAIVVGDRSWIGPTVAVAAVGILLALWVSRHRRAMLGIATACRIIGWLLICACLVNPLWSSARPRRGANVLAVVTDVSRSHLVTTSGDKTRADVLRQALNSGERSEPNGWINRIDQDFELQRYAVSDRLERVESFEDTDFDRPASNLCSALEQLQQRFAGQPLAGIVLLSDGNATDEFASLDELKTLAPVYPVIVNDDSKAADVAIGAVTVNQTAFDDAPVTIQVRTRHTNLNGQKVQLTLLDQDGVPLESKIQTAGDESAVRFEARPETGGTVFYTVKAALLDKNEEPIETEATTVNNERLIAVDRGSDKRRVLYVSGRPNWEYKFLRRAVETDPQTELVGLIRIAKKEAKFDFRGHEGESSNSLFRGFDETEQELAEEFDEPVSVRLGTKDETELEGGFPEKAEELFGYDALILDDIESEFFTADQLQLIYEFVSKRGGGFLMMGGQESFRQGEYDRTPVGELLPVDLHRELPGPNGPVQLSLTREGWLQPWVRLRSDEDAERLRVTQMPGFVTLNAASFIRPGAVVMAKVADNAGNEFPALVTQRFGRGRSAALCVGDLWRWRMNEGRRRLQEFSLQARNPLDQPIAAGEDPEEDLNDHARACRQMVRWLVGDVPKRLDVSIKPQPALGLGTVKLVADLKGRDFELREDADVRFVVTKPDGSKVEIAGEPAEDEIGRFEVVMSAVDPGAYTAEVTATVNDPETEPEELTGTIGWASQPDQEEMASVNVNSRFLNDIATATEGRVVSIDDLDSFVDDLSHTDAPLVEVWSWPMWHQWWVFVAAVGCFVTDWTLRRRQGLP
ncbi:putative membrane protein [Fuerstiella marisgermanici]|uniref:Putative membrane protein n=2 Tax=Fuerstiella marisgermanici TaxID=1891926 RepID=A0A1P8WNZ2_9PLAN|nr:putative membrane protein [Fuerstiella marisgermanici]